MFLLPANQRVIWFDQKLFPQSAIYNVCTCTYIHGSVDVVLFEKAINLLIAQNDVIRAAFYETDAIPYLDMPPHDPSFTYPVTFLDYSGQQNSHQQCFDWMSKESTIPLPYAENKLYFFALLKQSDDLYCWYTKIHHTMMDGWGASLLISKLAAIYEMLVKGESVPLESPHSYTEFIREDEAYTQSPSFKQDELYWLQRFATAPPVLDAGIKDDKKEALLLKSVRKSIVLDKDFYQAIRQYAAENEVTTFQFFLGVFYTWFSKTHQVNDLIIGVPVINRYKPSFLHILGNFVGILPFRMNFDTALTFSQLLPLIRDAFREDFKHQQFPIDEITRIVNAKDPGRLSLFDISLSFEKQNYSVPFNGHKTATIPLSHYEEKNPVAIFVRECQSEDDIKVDVDFNVGYWDEFYMEQFMEQLQQLLTTLLQQPEQVINQISLTTSATKAALTQPAPVKTTYHGTLVTHFEQTVSTYPNHLALEFEGKQYTYAALNAITNSLAHYLRNTHKVKPNEVVAFMIPKSDKAIITILGILKAGAAYLPIDPAYPEERIKFTLEDSGTKLLITESSFEIPVWSGAVLLLDKVPYAGEDNTNPPAVNTAEDTSYIIYTSGSTGKPKGAVIRHKGVVNTVKEHLKQIRINPGENCLQFASLSFDGSVIEIFMPLFSGAALLPASKDIITDFDRFSAFLHEKSIAALILPPSYLRNLPKSSLGKVKTLLTGGEAAIPRSELHLRDDQQYFNVYGPTECSICTTLYREDSNTHTNVSIGKPIGNMQVFILDQFRQILPYGVPGEIYIAGIGLAKGYLNNPALTAEKFIPSPFHQDALLYKSGDIGRWLSNGNIEYLGRTDDQVKIRGHRIEPGEIETTLILHEGVQNTAVVVKEWSSNEKSLYAFVVPQGDVTTDTLYTFLGEKLPHFMVPDRIILVEEIPLTINGKVDKRALLSNIQQEETKAYLAPGTNNEKLVAAIWQDLLGVSHISATDNFFQLGGHSLKVGQFINNLYKQTGIRLVFSEVFRAARLKDVAALLDTHETTAVSEITKAPESAHYPQSSSQKRLFLLHQIEGSSNSYNIPRVFHVKGQVDIQRLEQCFKSLIERHEALRTSFEMKDGVPVQIIHPAVPFSIGYTKTTPDEVAQLVRDNIRLFDLAKPPLLRAQLFDAGEGEQMFLFDMHHIISDGVSAALFSDELTRLYNGEELPPVAFQYKDFAVWQNDLLATSAIREQENYWLQQFADEVPVLSMQTDFPRPTKKTYNGKRIQVSMDADTTTMLEKRCIEWGCTLNQLLLAAYNVLLYKYTGNEDIITGTPVAGRTRTELDKMIGVFINTLAIRTFPQGKKTFSAFLSEVRNTSVEALRNQEYPFELLIDQLQLKRDMSRNPLFDTMFSFLHDADGRLTLGNAVLEPAANIYDTSKFDLLLEGIRTSNTITLNLEYSTDLFSAATAATLLQHYTNLLQYLLTHRDSHIADINILSTQETQLLLAGDTQAQYPKQHCLHHFFEEQVARVPHKTALVFDNQEMTYATLNEKANQVAAAVQAATNGAENPIVAVLLHRGMDMISAMLGILKAGAAYLPIDPDYPEERISYMLEDSGTTLLLTHTDIRENYHYDGHTIYIDQPTQVAFKPVAVKPQHLAYIIYTSGSTGKPKGTMIEHRNVVRLLFNDKNLFDFSENDTWTLFHSYCFDFSVWEMYGALLYGGKLVIIPKATAQNAHDFLQLLKQQQVTVLNQTPGAFYNLLAAELELPAADLHLRYVIFGGEALKPGKLKGWKEKYPGCKLVNMYGITETTVHVTYKDITQKEIDLNTSNIGRPIPTLSLLLLDRDGKLVPAGAAGELCVAGAGLARGYLNKPELSAERFINHPYLPNEKLYRSGDLARMLPDGDFEYLGRIDHQVKIRGFRIELGEIESKLMTHPAAKDTLVVDREDASGDKYLCAYVVADQQTTATDLRQHLSAFLPDYMVPAFFIILESFPLTGNGKIDRKQLPVPEDTILSTAVYEAPVTDTEKQLAALWMQLLNVPRVGLNDHFFELGGHSLKAVNAVAGIFKTFQVNLPLDVFFRKATIKEQALFIDQQQKTDTTAITAAPVQAFYPQSSSQKRLFLLHQIEGASNSYNIPGVFRIKGQVDIQRLEQCFKSLIERHEALRTSFEMRDGAPVQIIHPSVPFSIGYTKTTPEKVALLVRDNIRLFDLAQAPLLRAQLFDAGEGQQVFMFDMHHIISDGVSGAMFTDELTRLYNGEELPPVAFQYKDFAVWQNDLLTSSAIAEQANYWLQQFADEVPVLSMQTDFPRPAQKTFNGKRLQVSIDTHTSTLLEKRCLEWGCTLNQLMLAAYNVLLYKYAGNEDIITGIPVAGRTRAELDKVMGVFINTLAIRTFPQGNKSFSTFLSEVRNTTVEALKNQEYPFELLIDQLQLKRDMSRNPLFDTMFSFLHDTSGHLTLGNAVLEPIINIYDTSKFDLLLEGVRTSNNIILNLEYSTDLFSTATAEAFIQHYTNLLQYLLAHPDSNIADINILSAPETQLLLAGDAQAQYPQQYCLHHFFEEQVARVPHKTALVFDNQEMTYATLNEKANQVAAAVQAATNGAENPIVAVLLHRGMDMISVMLGILKAGAAYLPIDPDYPEERISYMLEDSGTTLLLTHTDIRKNYHYHGHTIYIDQPTQVAFKPVAVKPQDLAYIIYTSGSTGKPKGTMIEHCNVVRLLFNDKNLFDFSENDTWTLFHSYCFDFSVWEMYGALLYGGKLVIIPKATAQNAHDFLQLLKQQQVTVLNQTPGAFYNLLAAELEMPAADLHLRYVIFGGEALKPGKLKGWKEKYPGCKLVNMYGITETTVHVTYKDITQKEIDLNTSNIGKPIPTLSLLLLDRDGKLVPAGAAGELCVAGAGLARGYLNKPELSAERFINHPYLPNEKLYRSGDLARMLPDGDFEYLGRIDHQVKIRGFRIELGEIESKLMTHPAAKDTLVVDREDASGDKYLCAYVVADQQTTATDLRQHLSAFLPDYMVPAFFIILESFPLTGNGKIDRKQLPVPEDTILSTAVYEAPVTDTEKQLAALWMQLLNVPRVGLNDHFFELGGHSLKAVQLVALIHKHFNVSISIRQVFTTPALRGLAASINDSATVLHRSLKRAPAAASYPASAAEKRLFIINHIGGAGISYNIPAVYALEGTPDVNKLIKALHTLVHRHEILRTSFSIQNGDVIQQIQEAMDFEVAVHHCEDSARDTFIRDFIQPFDLSQAPLFRACVLKTNAGKYYLLTDMHHIIADGVAVENLLRELAASYNGVELPALPVQSRDFAVWQHQWLQSTTVLPLKTFWKTQFEQGTTLLNIPTDFVRPPVKSYEGAIFRFSIPRHTAAAIKETGRTNGATAFMVMLAAYNILLSKYSGQEDVIVGTPVSGRSSADVQELLGMFVNTLPLRSFPASEKTFTSFLEEVKELSLKAFENQDYPFEELLDDLEVNRDMSRNPLFDYMFTYRPGNKNEAVFADMQLRPLTTPHNISKMDLSLDISETAADELTGHIEYATRLFSEKTISRIAAHFVHILEQIAHQPQLLLKDITLMTAAEKEEILRFTNSDRKDTFSGTITDVYGLFEQHAQQIPDHIAVETDQATITYGELEKKVSLLATILTAAGCGPDKIVALCSDRSVDMIAAMLAILKAGAAFLPVDPDYPQDRIRYMLEDSNALLVLTQRKLADTLPSTTSKILLDELPATDTTAIVTPAHRRPDSLAYVIYTSGSTGQPKGVMIEQHSFHNAVLSNAVNFRSGFGQEDVCLSLSNISFDVSILEIFIPLVHGSKLVIVNREHLYDVQSLANVIVNKKISFCYVPPSLLQPLYKALKGSAPVQLNKLYVGVEPIKDTTLQLYISLNESMEIINGYGPTEAAVACTWYGFQPGNPKGVNIPIGRPIRNARIYIVNEHMQLQPVGVPGELCIAGIGLARGYLNKPDLTLEKFADNPFEPGQKLYRTGDLAKWQSDGNIGFIGRKDYQVKIRGFRIELGEIESRLMTHPEIKQALVTDKADRSGNKYLCAYVVSSQPLDQTALRAYLAITLPAYMVPDYFITLEKFPLTSNEKIDRKALPEPDMDQKNNGADLVLPANDTESKMLQIWETVLETSNISTTDNFFEIGGNSLRIINMLSLIKETFDDVLKVSDLFDKPTIREQAAAITKHQHTMLRQPSKAKRVQF
ncbi:non-ribosomal peptide synthetase [Chitinophaga flava]|uniref:Carrier domain-containing protein n=1 Tax=Chitinophaga flava TaxID=2259036 RepID=A0A365XXT7_9BACT|nr:non-ribosomal peptide synthetase [Chitinophaga flava]RBL91143.1 hypothetical protein DF182_00535 [Chitinophaga flava]